MSEAPASPPQSEFEDYRGVALATPGLVRREQFFAPATVRGILAIVAGTLILLRAGNVLTVIAVTLLVIAVVDLYFQLRPPRQVDLSVLSRVLIGVGIAVFLLLFPDTTGRVLSTLLAAYLGILGFGDLLQAWRNNGEGDRSWLLARGVVKLVLGMLVLGTGETLLAVILLVIAVAWIAAGVATVVTNIRADIDVEIDVRDTFTIFLRWLDLREQTADDRRILYNKLFFEGRDATRRVSRFFILMAFATAIATLGVVQDSTAVVIGAMLVAPLMTPLMGTAASMIMGWPRRTARSAAIAVSGVILAIGFSLILGALAQDLINVDTNSQILSRVNPNLVDLMVAIAAGGAGAFALSRPDVGDALPGVAVAIALVPPLTVVGLTMSVGAGRDALGALLLFATNAVAILFAGSVVFLLTGFTPLRRVLENRQWIMRTFTTIAIGGLVVFGVLAASSDRLTLNISTLSTATVTAEDWADGLEDALIFNTSVTGKIVEVSVASPEPPAGSDVDELAASMATDLSREVELTVNWVPRVELTSTAQPG